MVAALLLPESASAATFYVRASGDGSGTCPANDFTGSTGCTCRAAFDAANASPGSDTIELYADCFLSIIGDEDSNVSGDLDAWDSNSGTTLTVEMRGFTITWLGSVLAANRDRLIHVPPQTLLRRTVDLVIRGGDLLGGIVNNQSDGGGCVAARRALMLDSVNVEGCQHILQSHDNHQECGGAVESRGSLTVADSFFIQNSATNSNGGAICAYGSSTVDRTVFDGNQTITDGNGGAFAAVRPTTTVAFDRVEIEDSSSANEGGGLWSIGDTVEIIDSEIRWNQAANGAGIWMRVPASQGSDPIFERSLLWANDASVDGGGLYVQGGATETSLVIYNSTLSRNEAGNDGGAMYLGAGVEPYEVELRRSTVFENVDSGFDDNVAFITAGSPPPVELSYTGSLLAGSCPGGGTTTTLSQNLVSAVSFDQCSFFSGELLTSIFTLSSTLGLGNGGFARYHNINSFPDAWGGATCTTGEIDQANAARGSICDIGAMEEF